MATEEILIDLRPSQATLAREVNLALRNQPKQLPCKLFYDERGSQLFDRICESKDYYPTRTESSIMERNASSISEALGKGCRLVEYGSGSSSKTRILLDSLIDLRVYVPIDISHNHLIKTADQLQVHYPNIVINPLCADYTRPFNLPHYSDAFERTVVYFPGSTIGNFHPNEAVQFLKRMASVCGKDGRILIGVDLQKDYSVLNRAYNDSEGWTAAFNLNILSGLNDNLDTNFDISQFKHLAFYNSDVCRIEMHIESLEDQTVFLNGEPLAFHKGERIWTECSYKYTLESFSRLVLGAGLKVMQAWTDEKNYFSVQLLRSI